MPLWPLLVVLATGAVLVFVLVYGRRWFAGTRDVSDAFWCPVQARDVGVEIQVDVWDGKLIDVKRCSAFSPATAVTCEKRCLAGWARSARASPASVGGGDHDTRNAEAPGAL